MKHGGKITWSFILKNVIKFFYELNFLIIFHFKNPKLFTTSLPILLAFCIHPLITHYGEVYPSTCERGMQLWGYGTMSNS